MGKVGSTRNSGIREGAISCANLAFLLSFAASLLTSCVVTYHGFPEVDLQSDPLPRKEFPLYYHVDPLAYLEKTIHTVRRDPFDVDFPTRETYEELRRVFAETQMFSRTINSYEPPEKGIYCSVDVTYKQLSKGGQIFTTLTFFTFFFLPSYTDTSGHIVRYELYIDKERKKTYRYEITRARGMWLGLLPFIWVNLVPPREADAFRATAYQFLLDAERDGYLRQS